MIARVDWASHNKGFFHIQEINGMDLSLCEEHRMVEKMAHNFAVKELASVINGMAESWR